MPLDWGSAKERIVTTVAKTCARIVTEAPMQTMQAPLAHFDEQVAQGRMPVPFTHFPLGYPLLIAALSKTGLSL